MREQETLRGHAAELQEVRHLVVDLHALGHGLESERLAEHHDGARKLRSLARLGQAAHEGAVDLEDIDRETVQVRQRRVAGTEVVDREPNAQRLQLAELDQVRLGVVHHRAFGQLDQQALGLEAGDFQRVTDVADQVALLQVPARDVHGDAQALARRDAAAPLLDATAGVLQHPAPERDDLARLLRHRDELPRQHAAVHGVLPAHEGLDAEQLRGLQVDDRLELEEELAPGECLVQVVLEPQPLAQLFLHALVEYHVAALARGLGVVHRDVRVAQHVLGVVARRRERDADAGGHQHVVAVDRDRRAEGLGDRGGDALGLLDGGHALEQHRELVAAEAGDRVRRAGALDQALRRDLQQPVAGFVPLRVVDVLEVVEVDHEHREPFLGAPRERERVLDAVAEQAPVGEQRQGIVERELAQLVLERLSLGDVAQVQREPLHGGVVEQVAADALQDEAPRLGADRDLHRADRDAVGRGNLRQERGDALAVRLAPDVDQPAPDEVVLPEPEGALHRRRGVLDAALGVDDHDDVGRVADQRCEARLDQVHGLALALLGVVAQDNALPRHDQDREHEDRDGHDGDGPAAVPGREVDQHEEREPETRVGDALRQRARARRALALRPRLVADLHLGGGREERVAAEVEDVREVVAGNVVADDDRGGPHDVPQEHQAVTGGQQRERRLAQRAGRGVHQQHADRHEHQAVEGDVDLRQHEAGQLLLARGRGRADHEEPEEGAEAQDQDQRIEQQAAPGHAQRARPQRDEHAGDQDRKEGEVEKVGERRKRSQVRDPKVRVDHVAEVVRDDRGGQELPGPARRGLPRRARRDDREQRRRDGGRLVGDEPVEFERRTRRQAGDGHPDRRDHVDDHADGDGTRPAVGEPDARDAGGDAEMGRGRADFHASTCRNL